MFDPREEDSAESFLRLGLRELPVPEISADFEANIHAALSQPLPWWKTLWTGAKPVLSGAACSLVIMFALLPWATKMPTAATSLPRGEVATHKNVEDNKTNLYAASLWGKRFTLDGKKG